MSNYRKIPYPEPEDGLEALLEESRNISGVMKQRLSEAPLLANIFVRPEKADGINKERKIRRERQWDFANARWENIYEENMKPKKHTDFEGLYAFAELTTSKEVGGKEWVFRYVGISRNVMTRLKQHSWGNESNTATLAHLIAKQQELTDDERAIYSRKKKAEAMLKTQITEKLEASRKRRRDNSVKQYKVVVFRLEDERDYSMYFHEVAVAGILRCYWNSFRTH
jgi:hypothetical protein